MLIAYVTDVTKVVGDGWDLKPVQLKATVPKN